MGMVDFKRGQQHTALGKRLEEERMRSAAGGASSKAMRLQTAQKSLGKKMQAGSTASSAPVQGLTSQGAGAQMKSAGVSLATDMAANKITGGGTTGDTGEGAAGGMLQGGMSMASTGNPYAIAGGAIVGGITGALGARSRRKAGEAKAQAQHQERIGKIEGDKTERLNKALSGLAQQFGNTLNTQGGMNL